MAVPQKIVLKSTTNISLNERFSHIAQQVRQAPQATPVQQQVRARMAAQQQASSRNRRLAQQMANRPAVQAALKLKKRSMQQRLGSNVKSRLSLGDVAGNSIRGQRGLNRGFRGQRGFRGRGRGGYLQNAASLSGSQMSLNTVTTSPRGINRGMRRPNRSRGYTNTFRGTRGARGGRGSFTGVVAGYRGRARGRATRGRFQRARGQQRGAYNQRGRGRGGSSVTREQLDNQLEEYMSNQADNELDFI